MLRWKDGEFLTYLRQTRTRPSGYELAIEVWVVPTSGIRALLPQGPVLPLILFLALLILIVFIRTLYARA